MNIFIQPAGEDAKKQLLITILKKISLERLKQYITQKEYEELYQLYPNKEINMWGVTSSKQNVWSQMQNGDMVLFYGKQTFFVKGIIQYKLHNENLARNIWGTDEKGLTWQYIYVLDNAQNVDISLQDFNQVTGYRMKMVRGAMPIRKEGATENLLREYQLIFNNRDLQQGERKTAKLEEIIQKLQVTNDVTCNCEFKSYRSTRKRKETLKARTYGTKETSNRKELSDEMKSDLGIKGEKYIYQCLKNKTEELLKRIGITEYKEIIFYNAEYEKMKEDKSVGHGCDIELILKDGKHLYLEVKTSLDNLEYYTMTYNEYKCNIENADNYFVIKINNFKYLNVDERKINVTIIKNPYKIFMENIELLKNITFYTKY